MAEPPALKQLVIDRYRAAPETVRVVRSPYRICPLGAHIDHQLGQVTAMAIDQAVHVAYAPSGNGQVRLTSCDFPGETRFDLNHVPAVRAGDWGNYARGAVRALQQKHPLHSGICGVTAGRLDGGGLSSSAAIGVALLLALEDANRLQVSPEENIELELAIENDYLGLRIGILDQSAILLSRRGQLTSIDCLTRGYQHIEPPPDAPRFSILLAFSGLRQPLVATNYNRRVDECAAAARSLLEAAGRPATPPVLRSVTAAEYAQYGHFLRGPPARRAAHYFSEMDRVATGIQAWRAGDLTRFGQLISASGRSSIDNYQCGSPPLIDLYQTLVATPGVLGARFSGGGFRGCCVALVHPPAAEEAAARVLRQYQRQQPDLAGEAYTLICHSDDGACLL